MALKRTLSAALAGSPVDASALEEAIAQVFVSEDEALRQTLVRAREHGLPPIQISALQGKLLQVLAAACQARKILEIGALAGYSGIWLSRALPVDGRLITLEVDAISAELVRESFRQAHVDDRAEVRVGPALETQACTHAWDWQKSKGKLFVVRFDSASSSVVQRKGSLLKGKRNDVFNMVHHWSIA